MDEQTRKGLLEFVECQINAMEHMEEQLDDSSRRAANYPGLDPAGTDVEADVKKANAEEAAIHLHLENSLAALNNAREKLLPTPLSPADHAAQVNVNTQKRALGYVAD